MDKDFNYWINKALNLLIIVGIIIILGTVGECDYAAETVDIYYSETSLVKGLIIGGLCMMPGIVREIILGNF